MTIFEQELRKLFEQDTVLKNKKFVGNNCYGTLTDDIRVRIFFQTSGYTEHYDALRITLLNRREGPIDNLRLKLSDVWGMLPTNNPNFPKGINPHLWTDSGTVKWYGAKPGLEHYRKLTAAVNEYLYVFMEQEPVEGMTQQLK